MAVPGVTGLALFIYWRRVSQLRREKAAQDEVSRLIDSQEGERKRIAAELHDSLAQSLAIIKNRAELSLNDSDNHEKAMEQLDEIAVAASQTIDEVKEIAHNLRPYQLDRLGLKRASEALARKVTTTNGPQITTDIAPLDRLCSKESEINIYRIVQQSVTNIVKHAQATEASIRIAEHPSGLLLTIQDNGRGFQPATHSIANLDNTTKAGGFGLIGMAERARLLGGKLNVRSSPGQGTTISLLLIGSEGDEEKGRKGDGHRE